MRLTPSQVMCHGMVVPPPQRVVERDGLYNVSADPREEHDLQQLPQAVARLRAPLDGI